MLVVYVHIIPPTQTIPMRRINVSRWQQIWTKAHSCSIWLTVSAPNIVLLSVQNVCYLHVIFRITTTSFCTWLYAVEGQAVAENMSRFQQLKIYGHRVGDHCERDVLYNYSTSTDSMLWTIAV